MATLRVTSTLGALAGAQQRITVETPANLTKLVAKSIDKGATLARGFATKSAGAHGHLYPATITAEMSGATAGGWGPTPGEGRKQSGMSFEHGSRNQPPHLDLAKSADIVIPEFFADLEDFVDNLFW